MRWIHRWPVNFPHIGPVTRKMFPFDEVIMSPATKCTTKRITTNKAGYIQGPFYQERSILILAWICNQIYWLVQQASFRSCPYLNDGNWDPVSWDYILGLHKPQWLKIVTDWYAISFSMYALNLLIALLCVSLKYWNDIMWHKEANQFQWCSKTRILYCSIRWSPWSKIATC